MTYTPTTWADDTVMDYTLMNNAETQYDEGYTYYLAHVHDDRYYTRAEMESAVTGFWYAGNDGVASGCDAEKIYTTAHGALTYAQLITYATPSGIIILWAGSIVSIPVGWYLCDGNNGTPNLDYKWIVGAGSTYAVGASGGSVTCTANDTITVGSHTLTEAEMPAHTHAYNDVHAPLTTGSYSISSHSRYCTRITDPRTTDATGGGSSHTHTGTSTTTATENRPPSTALCYIMKA